MGTYYVDFSATYDGDGSAYTQAAGAGQAGAFNTIFGKSFVDGDTVWMRRASKTVTSLQTMSYRGVTFIGWPESGDQYYDSRPAAPQATWDADEADYATVTGNGTTYSIVQVKGANQVFRRVKFYNSGASGAYYAADLAGCCRFHNCYLQGASSLGYSVGCTAPDAGGTFVFYSCVLKSEYCALYPAYAAGNITVFRLHGCQIEAASRAVVTSNAYARVTLANCTVTTTNAAGTALYIGGSADFSCVDCTIDGIGLNDDAVLVSGAGTFRFCNLNVRSGTRIHISNGAGLLHVVGFRQTKASTTYGIDFDAVSANVVLVGTNLNFAPGNTLGDIRLQSHSIALLQGVGFQHRNRIETNGAIVYVTDDGPALGRFGCNLGAVNVLTSAVRRTAGAGYSLLISGGAEGALACALMNVPGLEPWLISLPVGATTVTVYGAYKMLNRAPPTKAELWASCEYLDQPSGFSRSLASSQSTGALDSDASEWSGDQDLTPFKLTLSFSSQQAMLSAVRLFCPLPLGTSCVYVDPQPVVA